MGDTSVASLLAGDSLAKVPTATEAGRVVVEFYEKRGLRAAWFRGGRLAPEARPFLEILDGNRPAGAVGAEQAALLAELEELGERELPDEEWMRLELGVSSALFELGARRAHGVVLPSEVEVEWHLPLRRVDLAAHLESALTAGKAEGFLPGLDPEDPRFARLEREAARYRAYAALGAWPRLELPEGKISVKAGESAGAAWLVALAERLYGEGFLDAVPALPAAVDPIPYEGELVEAVKRYQALRALPPDGNVGKATLTALNITALERVRQMEATLLRWRWVEPEPPGRSVLVNIPSFRVEVREGGTTTYAARVVVGKKTWPTPIFDDRITALILNPPWNVPDSIAADELVAKIQKDPEYLTKENLEVLAKDEDDDGFDPQTIDWTGLDPERLPFRLRQRPGRGNLLGKIKFSLPNEFNVYLHDTPGKSAFERSDRALSHGCVRVDKPFALANELVRGWPDWEGGKLEADAESGTTRVISLRDPIPVRIVYFTAAVTDDGKLELYRDIYGIDRAVLAVADRKLAASIMAGSSEAAAR